MDVKEKGVDVMSQLRIEITGEPLLTCACYYGDDMEEYRRFCSWEDNIKMALKEIVSM